MADQGTPRDGPSLDPFYRNGIYEALRQSSPEVENGKPIVLDGQHLLDMAAAVFEYLCSIGAEVSRGPIPEGIEPLLELILDDMRAATNRDLACDGPVGDEEGKVWARIEVEAERLRVALSPPREPAPLPLTERPNPYRGEPMVERAHGELDEPVPDPDREVPEVSQGFRPEPAPEEVEAALRQAFEGVPSVVGLLRMRAKNDDDAELARWGETLRQFCKDFRAALSSSREPHSCDNCLGVDPDTCFGSSAPREPCTTCGDRYPTWEPCRDCASPSVCDGECLLAPATCPTCGGTKDDACDTRHAFPAYCSDPFHASPSPVTDEMVKAGLPYIVGLAEAGASHAVDEKARGLFAEIRDRLEAVLGEGGK